MPELMSQSSDDDDEVTIAPALSGNPLAVRMTLDAGLARLEAGYSSSDSSAYEDDDDDDDDEAPPTKRRKLDDSASASHDGAAEDTSLPRTAGVASHWLTNLCRRASSSSPAPCAPVKRDATLDDPASTSSAA